MQHLLNFDHTKQKQQGYVAISSVLVIAAVVFIISVSVALLSVNDIQSSLAQNQSEVALHFVEGCTEDALLKLNSTNTISSPLSFPEGTCTITIDSQTGNNWTFTVTGTKNTYTKRIQVSATRSTTVAITQWKAL